MKFIYSLNRKHDGRSLSSFLSLGDHLKASWEMSWPERKKQFGVIALFRLRLNPCTNQMKRFIRFDGSINQISLQIWLRKWPIRTVVVELRCIYKHSSPYFQPFNQRYIAGFSKNKVGKEHLKFNCEDKHYSEVSDRFYRVRLKMKGSERLRSPRRISITIVICICLTSL